MESVSGVIHRRLFGDHTDETAVLLAYAGKVPSVMLLMALDEDDANVNFDIRGPIADYLPWQGAWDTAITTEQLVANRSGIPGLNYIISRQQEYLVHGCQFFPFGSLLDCVEFIDTTPLAIPSTPPNTAFDYGGSQWHPSGGIAELVGGDAWGCGMGWWIIPPEEGGSIYLYVDPGLYGSISWLDIERDYGGVVLFEEYTTVDAQKGSRGVVNELIPIIESALDVVR